MAVQFYDVKKREKVDVAEDQVKKTKYVRETSKGEQVRYALKAEVDGTRLTKFVSKDMWDSLNVPEV